MVDKNNKNNTKEKNPIPPAGTTISLTPKEGYRESQGMRIETKKPEEKKQKAEVKDPKEAFRQEQQRKEESGFWTKLTGMVGIQVRDMEEEKKFRRDLIKINSQSITSMKILEKNKEELRTAASSGDKYAKELEKYLDSKVYRQILDIQTQMEEGKVVSKEDGAALVKHLEFVGNAMEGSQLKMSVGLSDIAITSKSLLDSNVLDRNDKRTVIDNLVKFSKDFTFKVDENEKKHLDILTEKMDSRDKVLLLKLETGETLTKGNMETIKGLADKIGVDDESGKSLISSMVESYESSVVQLAAINELKAINKEGGNFSKEQTARVTELVSVLSNPVNDVKQRVVYSEMLKRFGGIFTNVEKINKTLDTKSKKGGDMRALLTDMGLADMGKQVGGSLLKAIAAQFGLSISPAVLVGIYKFLLKPFLVAGAEAIPFFVKLVQTMRVFGNLLGGALLAYGAFEALQVFNDAERVAKIAKKRREDLKDRDRYIAAWAQYLETVSFGAVEAKKTFRVWSWFADLQKKWSNWLYDNTFGVFFNVIEEIKNSQGMKALTSIGDIFGAAQRWIENSVEVIKEKIFNLKMSWEAFSFADTAAWIRDAVVKFVKDTALGVLGIGPTPTLATEEQKSNVAATEGKAAKPMYYAPETSAQSTPSQMRVETEKNKAVRDNVLNSALLESARAPMVMPQNNAQSSHPISLMPNIDDFDILALNAGLS